MREFANAVLHRFKISPGDDKDARIAQERLLVRPMVAHNAKRIAQKLGVAFGEVEFLDGPLTPAFEWLECPECNGEGCSECDHGYVRGPVIPDTVEMTFGWRAYAP